MTGARIVTGDAPLEEPVVVREEAPDSLMARLRARAAEAQRERTLDLPVPGDAWNGELILRFKPLNVTETDRFAAKTQSNSGAAASSVAMDMLARACVGVYGLDGGRLTQLGDADGPVRLEHRLGVLLGMATPPGAELTAHEVIIGLFGGEGLAIDAFATRVFEWMRNRETEGQSPGEA